jgi:hypothetical protein
MTVEAGPYGPNSAQVEALLEHLRELPPRKWARLDKAFRSMSEEKFEDALAGALDSSGLREEWFALRHAATEIARAAAKAYAAATGEEPRTLEYNKSVDAWDGHRETAFTEQLPPGEEQGFIDAACGACGVLFMRPFVAASVFTQLWSAVESAVPALD